MFRTWRRAVASGERWGVRGAVSSRRSVFRSCCLSPADAGARRLGAGGWAMPGRFMAHTSRVCGPVQDRETVPVRAATAVRQTGTVKPCPCVQQRRPVKPEGRQAFLQTMPAYIGAQDHAILTGLAKKMETVPTPRPMVMATVTSAHAIGLSPPGLMQAGSGYHWRAPWPGPCPKFVHAHGAPKKIGMARGIMQAASFAASNPGIARSVSNFLASTDPPGVAEKFGNRIGAGDF